MILLTSPRLGHAQFTHTESILKFPITAHLGVPSSDRILCIVTDPSFPASSIPGVRRTRHGIKLGNPLPDSGARFGPDSESSIFLFFMGLTGLDYRFVDVVLLPVSFQDKLQDKWTLRRGDEGPPRHYPA